MLFHLDLKFRKWLVEVTLEDVDSLVNRRRKPGQGGPVVVEGEPDELHPGALKERVKVTQVDLWGPG